MLLSLLSVLTLTAQSITGVGYVPQPAIPAAPGQIVTFYASGIGRSIFQATQAQSATLPYTLAGITVNLRQGANTLAVPILEVAPVTPCPTILTAQATGTNSAGLNLCASYLSVTVQIPYEIKAGPGQPALILIADGTSQSAIEINALADQVHILSTCDYFLNTVQPSPPPSTGLPCSPVVTHPDGTYISASRPAKPGETVTAWAVGLGAAAGAATGQPSRQAQPVAGAFVMSANYQVNALPAKPFAATLPLPKPLYVGLAAGYPGLY